MEKSEFSWHRILSDEIQKEYYLKILNFIDTEFVAGKTIYPSSEKRFSAFDLTPFDSIKVVILGQDPYHNQGQAHGLSFSVPQSCKIPPSLKNIFKELSSDLDISTPLHGNLEGWAKQGIFLLNSILSVEAHKPGSHAKIGWEQFTDFVIHEISEKKEHVVFMLWGNYAIQKLNLIDEKKHLVLKAAHPSPFSAYRGFLGCKHFSQANTYLNQNGLGTVDWHVLNNTIF